MDLFTNAIPKELLPVREKAEIGHVVDAMKLAEVEEIAVAVNSHKHDISDYLGSGKRFGLKFTCTAQDELEKVLSRLKLSEYII
ncbi:MAG: hypothetical protein PHQ34_01065 [Methanothrix sp.]|nr:hypothetical protein [Methanothrix sp.]